mmetsp:Transcript_10962/g.23022  ORF Transcript_10962/g.23022 Transcript_10962/m.23022 type:complete len:377 (-) Transcript_10962:133-1263(-)
MRQPVPVGAVLAEPGTKAAAQVWWWCELRALMARFGAAVTRYVTRPEGWAFLELDLALLKDERPNETALLVIIVPTSYPCTRPEIVPVDRNGVLSRDRLAELGRCISAFVTQAVAMRGPAIWLAIDRTIAMLNGAHGVEKTPMTAVPHMPHTDVVQGGSVLRQQCSVAVLPVSLARDFPTALTAEAVEEPRRALSKFMSPPAIAESSHMSLQNLQKTWGQRTPPQVVLFSALSSSLEDSGTPPCIGQVGRELSLTENIKGSTADGGQPDLHLDLCGGETPCPHGQVGIDNTMSTGTGSFSDADWGILDSSSDSSSEDDDEDGDSDSSSDCGDLDVELQNISSQLHDNIRKALVEKKRRGAGRPTTRVASPLVPTYQ